MGNSSIRGMLVALVATLMLAGCATSQPAKQGQSAAASAGQSGQQAAASSTPAPQPAQPAQAAQAKPTVENGKLVMSTGTGGTETLPGVFYFDFDQAIVKPAGFSELNKDAEALKNDPSLKVLLEGNTDERGTREYNLALGQRRADAVKDYLVAQGVSPAQISTVSYGEERPVALGHNPAAWAKNRRVDLVYQ